MLTGNYFIDALPENVRQKLAFQLLPVKLAKGEILYTQGLLVEFLYFPVTAVLSRSLATDDGLTMEVGLVGKESAAGTASIYNFKAAFSSCEVLVGGSAFRMRADRFVSIAASDAALASDTMRLVDMQSKRMSRKLLCDRYHSVEQRLATWLLGLRDRRGRSLLPVTHAEAARAFGVHRPTITDVVHGLRDRGVLRLGRRSIELLDTAALEELACECREAFPVKPRGSAAGGRERDQAA